MKSRKVGKMATALTVLLLVLSGLAVVQWNAQPVEAIESDAETHTVYGFIESEYSIDADLDIKLRNLRTGEIRDEMTEGDYYEFDDVTPGWYEVIFPSQLEDGISYFRTMTEPLKIEEDTREDIEVIDKEADMTLEGYVFEDEDAPLEGATVTLEEEENGHIFTHTVDTEKAEFENENYTYYFETKIHEDFEGRFMVEKPTYSPYFEPNFSPPPDEEQPYNVTLDDEPAVNGRLVDEEGRGIRGRIDITLYNEEVGLIQETKEGPRSFRIGAPAGYDYIMVVDAHGEETEDAPTYEPFVTEIEDLEGTERLGELEVGESQPEVFETTIDFVDADEVTVESTRTLNSATRMRTLDHSDIGYLPMQLDLALGEGDQDIGDDVIDLFKERLEYSEADIPTTQEFLKVNETIYELEDFTIEFEGMDELGEGEFTEPFEGEIVVTANREYEAVEDVGEGPYQLDLVVDHDHTFGNRREFDYTVELMDGFERYDDIMVPQNVDIEGYTTLEIDPGYEEEMKTSHLIFALERSEVGEVSVHYDPGEQTEPERIFQKRDDHFVMRDDTEAIFRAHHENPVSHVVNYTWELEGEEIGYEEELQYTFEETDVEEKTLTLIVEESNGEILEDTVTIVIDEEGPEGTIMVDGEEIPAGTSTSVDEDQEVNFTAENFVDHATGNISNYQWNFTDEDEIVSGEDMEQVNYTFEVPGSYDVILNVTDPLDNWNEVQITVDVADTTPPDVVIRTEWNDEHTYDDTVDHDDLRIGTEVTFNATESQAHPEYEGELESFEWLIEDEDGELMMSEEDEEILENVTFDHAMTYTVWLNVTDVSGNYANESIDVNVQRGPTPILNVDDLRFSEDTIRVGDSVTISVNVTNDGDANATDVRTELRIDGELIDADWTMYKDGEEQNEIGTGEEVRIDINWEPEDSGEKTVNVNVTDAEEREHPDLLFGNEQEETVTVEGPAWREWIVYILIPVIIIGVTVGLYKYKDTIKEKLGK